MYVRQYVQQHANVNSESPYALKVFLSLWCSKAQRHFNIEKAPIPVKILKYYSRNQYYIQYNTIYWPVLYLSSLKEISLSAEILHVFNCKTPNVVKLLSQFLAPYLFQSHYIIFKDNPETKQRHVGNVTSFFFSYCHTWSYSKSDNDSS